MKNISVIGIGKLGLCFSLTMEKCGYNVLGVDINRKYVDMLNKKQFKSDEENVEKYLLQSKNFKASTNLKSAIEHSDVLFVVVATPSLKNGRYDHKQVDNLVEELKKNGKQKNKHLVICCTTMPSYCDSVQEELQSYGYTVSYNPEFIAQGTILRDQARPDMVLIGEGSKKAGDILEKIYIDMTDNEPKICRMSRTEAEICKISLNCFLTTKIAFTNMIGDIVSKSGGRPQIVLNAIGSDTRVGTKLTRYGFGYGGPCFPRDNRSLAIYAIEDLNLAADISVATDKMNKKHLQFQVNDFIRKNKQPKAILFSEITSDDYDYCFEPVTYKKGSTMIEEAQQLKFAVELSKLGHDVTIRDKKVVIDQIKNVYGNIFKFWENP